MRAVRLLLAPLLALSLLAAPAALAADDARYALVHGCYAMSVGGKAADGGPFRMQPTRLGAYLLYGKAQDFYTASGMAAEPSPAADWEVTGTGPEFTLKSAAGQTLTGVRFEKADGCATYPEIETSTTGTPRAAPTGHGEVKGLIDTHLHHFAYEFAGGAVHCGRPWHPYGVAYALVDCPDHQGEGLTAVTEHATAGPGSHGPDGWPSFTGWPKHFQYTHEMTYWKWMERAWLGGLRLYVNLLVDNRVLCDVYPLKRNPCNEMNTVRLEAKRMYEFQDYVDAQYGGPGKGWYRIVTDPFQARRVISEGKLAVVPGIEVSELFDCGEFNFVPRCDRAQIDAQLDEVYRMGVRQMELVNKFDNGFTGVAGDAGTFGLVTNTGNRYSTGHYLAMQTCTNENAEHDHDKPQVTNTNEEPRDPLVGKILSTFLPPGTTPAYPPTPHCNQQGLTPLGAYLLRRMAERGMIFDPDHMSVLARDQALSVMGSLGHPGVMTSHSWSTPDAYKRIAKMGGINTPSEKSVKSWMEAYRFHKSNANPRFYFGTGVSTDQNGFASQAGPRSDHKDKPLAYPFKSFDGVTLDKQKSGTRTFDLNADGVAHYGLYPDFVQDIRTIGGEEAYRDLVRGAEAYLQMWERAVGVPATRCRSIPGRFSSTGVSGVRLGDDPERALRRSGQPDRRPARSFRWCVEREPRASVVAGFSPQGRVAVVGSTARRHTAAGVGTGASARRLGSRVRAFGRGVRVRPARGGRMFVYGVRRGKVSFVAVAARSASRTPAGLRSALRAAGLR